MEFIVFDMEESDTTNDKRYHPLKEIVQGGTYAESERAMLNDLLRTSKIIYKISKKRVNHYEKKTSIQSN